jgi:hypothetical protein
MTAITPRRMRIILPAIVDGPLPDFAILQRLSATRIARVRYAFAMDRHAMMSASGGGEF